MTRCSAIVITLVLVMAAVSAAQVTTTCEFNETTQQLDYSISGGQAGAEYTLSAVVIQGCVDIGTPPPLSGPSDAKSVDVLCQDNRFNGFLKVEICQQSLCFATYDLYLYCDESCVVHERDAVPTTGPLGLAFLILFLTGVGVVLGRRLAPIRS